jgi:electron transfer flavoprotein alpha subunit
MSVLVFVEGSKGKVKKASLEAVNYAARLASQLGGGVTALWCSGEASNLDDIGRAGAAQLWTAADAPLVQGDAQALCAALEQAVAKSQAKAVLFSHDFTSKAVAPMLAARLKAGLVSAAVADVQVSGGTLSVVKSVFSGKATAEYHMRGSLNIITLLPNTFAVTLSGNPAAAESFAVNLSGHNSPLRVKALKKESAELSLPEAELVVSAGRGLKGPEHWGIIEDLAKSLGAATACSRPVSDIGWRPHHEHVGQTGIAIRPNLYIAVGISGAIQHLAGVNGSKTIVVINKDAEAPFFKSADYGVVGDAFEVVPRLIEAVKKFKAAH